jgi:predicted enzyme related to lactoylglutathione lyase
MPDGAYSTAQITLAAIDTPAMVRFYDAVFAADLQPVAAYGTTLYRGTLSGVAFVICPNDLADVDARQSRHQYTYTVPNLADTVALALAEGGTIHQAARPDASPPTTILLDPDGNSIVFVEAQAADPAP